MASAVAWNGDVVTVPDQRQPRLARSQTIVSAHGEHASVATSLEHVLANAVMAAVGDPEALVMVDPAWVTVVQWYAGIEAAWHAETPCEWADAIDSAPLAADTAIQAGILDDAMGMGLLDAVLDWREGWPPETEGW